MTPHGMTEPSLKENWRFNMKTVKSLLLGTAAGLLTVAGAQAADLPVKAKPAEYVKVCSLYGAGFFFIPGTDTCLKIGGMVRAEYSFGSGGANNQFWSGTAAQYARNTDDFRTRARTQISFDARTQTEYGTLRSFARLGMQYSSTNGTTIDGQIYFDRAFIQLGGFTFGKTQSFYEAFSGTYASYTTLVGGSHTANGVNGVAAYTAQLGNGFSGTVSIEDAVWRRAGILNTSQAVVAPGVAFVNTYGGQQVPDIIGNLRVDQTWGSAQLSAALHQVRASYYGASAATTVEGNGSPDDKWGFAVQGAAQFRLPWAKGDTLTFQASYSEGAPSFINATSNGTGGSTFGVYSGRSVFAGLAPDAVVRGTNAANANATSLQLTKVWGVNIGLEHYWIPSLRTSVFADYMKIDFNDTASAALNTWLTGQNAVGSPDWNMYSVGTRTVWNPVKNLEVGFEVLYTKLDGSYDGLNTVAINPGGTKPAGTYSLADQDIVSGIIRVQRNFWP
jgi:hypothetical protein